MAITSNRDTQTLAVLDQLYHKHLQVMYRGDILCETLHEGHEGHEGYGGHEGLEKIDSGEIGLNGGGGDG